MGGAIVIRINLAPTEALGRILERILEAINLIADFVDPIEQRRCIGTNRITSKWFV